MNFWTFLDRNWFGVGAVLIVLACVVADILKGKDGGSGCHLQVGGTVQVQADGGAAP